MTQKSIRDSQLVSASTRRDPREDSTIFISVSGFDSAGHFFTEHTATLNVSEHGCCFRLNREIPCDSLLAIQTLEHDSDASSRTALYQIAWMEKVPKGSTLGAARLHGGANWFLTTAAGSEHQTPKA